MSFACRLIRTIVKGPLTFSINRNLSTASRILSNVNVSSIITPISCSLNNSWIWQKQEQIELPISHIKPITLPNGMLTILPLTEPERVTNKIIEDPLSINNDTKQAVRLIVIRRKKMKKHKLRKLRKRMYHEHMKLKQRRELKKEKDLHAQLIAQCKNAEAFSAENYVLDKLRQATLEPPPAFKDTPEFKELMRIKKLRLNVPK